MTCAQASSDPALPLPRRAHVSIRSHFQTDLVTTLLALRLICALAHAGYHQASLVHDTLMDMIDREADGSDSLEARDRMEECRAGVCGHFVGAA